MKIITFLFLFIFFSYIHLQGQTPQNLTGKDVSVMVTAKVLKSPNYGIELNWPLNGPETSFEISRRTISTARWTILGTVQVSGEKAGDILKYFDANVEKGTLYEYQIKSSLVAKINYGGDLTTNINGFGYIAAGEAVEGFIDKAVLLLVDTTFKEALSTEIQTLKNDLLNEGWFVTIRYAPRAESFDAAKVKAAKAIILEEYQKSNELLSTVFLIGRVPVPYSGNIVPDGHKPDHEGAWPADCYYGDMNESKWKDATIDNSAAGRAENKNIPGDGKFDHSAPATNLELMVGRIDFFNLPIFQKTEVELLKQYLYRNHKFRTNSILFNNKGIVSDNFGAYGLPESFGANGWRNFGTLLGAENVSSGNLFEKLALENHLWSYGCGGGSYTSAGGIGVSSDFTTKKYDAIFTMLFGSYFGDWDVQNNLMRSSLASEPAALTCAWAARPPWFFHHMAMGYPIGYSQRLSVNNKNDYGFLAYINILIEIQGQPVIYTAGINQVHAALLGDPTLTMFPAVTNRPKNIKLTQLDKNQVKVEWELPNDQQIDGVDIYHSTTENGPWVKVTTSPVKTSSYIDFFEPIDGPMYYLIRSAYLQQGTTGSFYLRSAGLEKSIIITDAEENPELTAQVECSPNPAIDYTDIKLVLDKSENVKLSVYNMAGQHVKTFSDASLISGSHLFEWDLKDAFGIRVPAGVYLVKAQAGSRCFAYKLVVN